MNKLLLFMFIILSTSCAKVPKYYKATKQSGYHYATTAHDGTFLGGGYEPEYYKIEPVYENK